MKPLLIAFLAGGFALAQTPAPKKTITPTTAAAPNLLNPASMRAKAPEMFKVKMTTTKGDVIIQVNRGWAPLGVDRFYNLIRGGFYKDAAFFRIVPGFVAQFGIPARPDVGAAWEQAKIPDDRVLQSNKRGTLTFATAGPGTRTTQIFINFGDNARLDSDGFAPFGQVVEGMEIVDKFFAGYGEAPRQDLITSQGKMYLDRSFPNLDRILSTTILPNDPPADKK